MTPGDEPEDDRIGDTEQLFAEPAFDEDDPDAWWNSTQAVLYSRSNAEFLRQVDSPTTVTTGSQRAITQEVIDWFKSQQDVPDDDLPMREHHVTAVIVSHNGAAWLPALLNALAESNRAPDALIAVDAASTDPSVQLLSRQLGHDRVIALGENPGFGDAVQIGLANTVRIPAMSVDDRGQPIVDWVWLLHDDCAPEPDCLAMLLSTSDANPQASVLGPKILGWHDQRLLLEVGASITGTGLRYTGLERREHDQGQHDGVRPVLSVSSAGMLVRRDVWEHLAGLDPRLPLFRDDLDFCWRAHQAGEQVLIATDAVLHHREAAANGQRADSLAGRAHRADRQAASQVLLSHARGLGAFAVWVRLVAGGVVRALTYALGKDIATARDELLALLAVLVHPGRVRASRRLVMATAIEPSSIVADLRPSAWGQFREALGELAGRITTSNATTDAAVSALESGPTDDAAAYLDSGPGIIRRLLTRPGVLLFLGLSVVSIAATRMLWLGDGVLQGGALLPSPAGIGDLWSLYAAAWHNVGPGSTAPGAPYLMLLWLVGVPLLGKASLAVTIVLLLAVPFAGWSAWFALRGVITSVPIRLWAAVAYATVPAVTGAISSGRIGTCIAAFLLPFTIRSLARIARPQGTVRRAAGTALLLAAVLAVAPILWATAALVGIGFVVLMWSRVGRDAWPVTRRFVVAVLAPLLLLAPWSLHLLAAPARLLLQPGVTSAGTTDASVTALDVLLLHPGGPGMTPLWVSAAIIGAALLALLRTDRILAIAGCWAVAILALAVGLLQTLVPVYPPGATTPVPSWTGQTTLMIAAALITAVALAADGLRERRSGASFSLVTPLLLVLAALLAASPVLSFAAWFPQAQGLMRRAPAEVVPAFVAADAASPQAPRTLVLRADRDGGIRYSLVNGAGPLLGDADVEAPADAWRALDPLVAALASGRGGDEVRQLAQYGIRYVLLASGTSEQLVPVLDGEPGLRRLSTSEGQVLWSIAGVTSRARQVTARAETSLGVAQPSTVATDPYLDQRLPDYAAARQIIVGALADSGWRAGVVERDRLVAMLPPVTGVGTLAWSQAFAVPSGSPQVRVWFDSATRSLWLWGQLAVLVMLVVLALPSRRVEDLDPGVEVAQWDELVPVQRWTAAIPLPADHAERLAALAGGAAVDEQAGHVERAVEIDSAADEDPERGVDRAVLDGEGLDGEVLDDEVLDGEVLDGEVLDDRPEGPMPDEHREPR